MIDYYKKLWFLSEEGRDDNGEEVLSENLVDVIV